MDLAYEIIGDGKAIKCHVCGMTSWSEGDVEHLYCAKCNRFHGQPDPVSLTDDQYELLDFIFHGWTPLMIGGSRAYTKRLTDGLLQLGLVKDPARPRITSRGLMAKQAHEILSKS